jgi:four helix bundle protein
MGVKRFEDLIAWQKARQLVKDVYGLTRDGGFSRDLALKDQLQRATVSIMSNIAEGFELRSRPQFRRFLGIAKGSCAEVRSLLYVANDVGYIADSRFDNLLAQAAEVGRIIGGLQVAVSTSRGPSTRNSELGTRNSQ